MSVDEMITMAMIHMHKEGLMKTIHDSIVVGLLDNRIKEPNDRGK